MNLKKHIRVLIVDDYSLMREGIRAMLEKEQHLQVIGEAEMAYTFELVAKLQPDVVLRDIGIKSLNGLQLLQSLAICGVLRVLIHEQMRLIYFVIWDLHGDLKLIPVRSQGSFNTAATAAT